MTVQVAVNLTEALKSQLSTTYKAWAVYFDKNGKNPQWTSLTGLTNTVEMPQRGGLKLYLILQDTSPSGVAPVHVGGNGAGGVSDGIQVEGDIVAYGPTSSAHALNYRYDSFEVSFTGNAADAGNLTDINGFGIPMELSVGYGTGTSPTSTATRGYHLSGGTVSSGGIWSEISSSSAGGAGSIQYWHGMTGPRMGISPAAAVGNHVPGTNYKIDQWNPYISAVASSTATTAGNANQIQLAGFFNGAPDANGIWHNGGFYAYDVTYDIVKSSFVLKPGSTSQIKGDITISAAELANSIYLTLGNASVSGLADPNGLGNNAQLTINTGVNTQWGAVLRDFIAGFSVGHWNTSASSVNPHVSATINLNKEWNQDGTYSFGGSIPSGAGSVTTPAPQDYFYDPYAKIFFLNTNSYGTGYSDFAARGASAGPLINVTDGTGTGEASKFITLTLFADSDQPTGYTSQTFNNYISASSYLPANYIDPNGPMQQLSFGVGTMSLDPDTPVTIVLKGAGAHGADERVKLVHDGGSSGGFASPGSYGAAYTISSIGSGYSAGSATSNSPGFINIKGLPVHSGTAGGVLWYQIEVGSGTAQKTFNLYETVDSSGRILNPAYSGQSADLAIDGLAAATAVFPSGTNAGLQQYISGSGAQVGINFQAGGTNTLDPSLMTVVPMSAAPGGLYQPTAPLVGMRPGYTSTGGAPFLEMYQPWSAQPTTPTVYNGGLVFGWTGADSEAVLQQAAAGSSYVGARTNKIGAGNVARLSFTAVGAAALPAGLAAGGYLSATADADGVWATGTPVSFGNGTYTVQMQEFLPTDPTFQSALNSASVVQSFTVSQGAIVAGSLTVSSGQSAGITVESGGAVTVLSGGTAVGTLVSSGGVMHVSGGAGDSGSIVLGQHYVSSGATAFNAVIASGGSEFVYGSTSGTSVNGGGLQVVGNGTTTATAFGTYVNSGAHQHAKGGGLASGTFVLNGGVLAVDSAGSASNVTIYDGAFVHVSAGGVLNGGSMSGGTLEVFASGSVASTSALTLMAGFSGVVNVWAGGTTPVNLTLQAGNRMYINSGATAEATADAGGEIIVSSGGSAGPGTTANYTGRMWVYSGGWVAPTLNSGGRVNALEGAIVSGATVIGGTVDVGGAGAQATGGFIHAGSYEYVHNGATATSTTLSAGQQSVWGVGTTATSTSVQLSGGFQYVYSGASAVGTHVSSGGGLWAWHTGTTVNGATVSSGGNMVVHTSAIASDVALNGGTVEFLSAGSGSVQIGSAGSIVRLGQGATSGVSVSGFAAGMGAIDFDDIGYTNGVTSATWSPFSVGATSGTLTITSGTLHAAVTLFGIAAASNDQFQLGTDGHGTTVTTTASATGSLSELLAPPHA